MDATLLAVALGILLAAEPAAPAPAVPPAAVASPDRDADGVPDPIDACPDTRHGYPVSVMGCAADSDRDGVPDGRDRCPGTPEMAPGLDGNGCSEKDRKSERWFPHPLASA